MNKRKNIIAAWNLPACYIRRSVAVLLAAVFVLSSVITGTLAWLTVSQGATNDAWGDRTAFEVRLVKYEKDTDDSVTIEGAEFYLYRVGSTPGLPPDGNDVQIGGRYLTDAGGKIEVMLEPGEYYFFETNPVYPYTYDADKNDDIKEYRFTITGDETEIIEIKAYNQKITGDLIIEKTVKNIDDSALTPAQLETEFEFTVTFSDGGTYTYKIDNGEEKPLASGGLIELKHGQKAVFDNIPSDVTYTITEAQVMGYTTTSTNHQGTITEGSRIASFVNTYGGNGSLIIEKTVAGTGANTDEEFEFTATINGIEHTFTLKDGESKTFDNLPVGVPYTVTEGDYTEDGYIASPTEYTGQTVHGNLTLPFVNVYDDHSGDPGSLKITKTVVGVNPNPDAKFAFMVDFTLPDSVTLPVTVLVNDIPTQLSTLHPQLSIQLKHGESVLIENLPAGTAYQIEETPADGYTAAILTAEGVIISNHTVGIGFINYVPQDFNLIIRKAIDGEAPDGYEDTVFHFILEVEGEEPEPFTLTAGETTTFTVPVVGVPYTIREVDIPAGWSLTHVENGSGTTISSSIVAEFTNTYTSRITIDIEGEKTWNLNGETPELPGSIVLTLKNGEDVVDIAIVTQDDKWKYSWNVPKYDEEGKEIDYKIEETLITNWRPEYDPDSFDIVNIYVPPAVLDEITVEKVITGATPQTPAQFKFTLTALDGAVPSAEIPMPFDSADGVKTITITGEDEKSFGAITYTAPGTYVYTISEVNTGEDGYTYDESIYTLTVVVEEKSDRLIIASKILTKDGQSAEKAVFINGYNPDHTNIRVTKVWKGDGDHPQSVQVQLYKGGTAHGTPVTLNVGNEWTHLWSGLDKSAVWTVDEVNVPFGYAKTVTGNAETGFIVTNTKGSTPSDGKVIISGIKTWDHGNLPEEYWPESITILVKDGDRVVVQRQVTVVDHWRWSFRLDKYDADGREIVYTVDEIKVPGYTKKVDGYNVKNTYNPDDPDKPPQWPPHVPKAPGNGPNTGDDSNMTLWLSMMILSSLGLVATFVIGKRNRERYGYEARYLKQKAIISLNREKLRG